MTTIDETRITDPEEIERILEERAVALAQSTDDEAHGEHITFVIVRLGSERYAMPIDCVREIKPLDRVTALSATPPFWLGLANLRRRAHRPGRAHRHDLHGRVGLRPADRLRLHPGGGGGGHHGSRQGPGHQVALRPCNRRFRRLSNHTVNNWRRP